MKLIITDREDLPCAVEGEYQVIRPQGEIRRCTGCFGCWVKTPGQCVIHDGYETTGQLLSRCDELILVSRCVYGSTSPFVKAVLDRAISYIHPDFTTRGGEMHHKRRYDNSLALSAYFYGPDVTESEKAAARHILTGNARNYDGQVKRIAFFRSPGEMEGLTL